MGAPWTHPTPLWHPSSPCLVGRGYRLSENWWEKKTRSICLLYKSASLPISAPQRNKPVEKEMDRYGAEMPHCMSIEDPEHWGEVQQLQQGQTMKQQHHQATLPPIWQGPPVLPAPTQPPQQVHQAWERQKQAFNTQDWDTRGSTARQKIQCELHQWWRWQPYCSRSRNWQRSGRTRVRWRPRSGRLPLCSTRWVSSGPKFWVERMQMQESLRRPKLLISLV